jgi:hypothetical protein
MPLRLPSFWKTIQGATCYTALLHSQVRPSLASAGNTCFFPQSPLALLHTSSPVFTSNTTTAATMTVDDTFTFVGQPHLIFGQKFEPQFRFKASQYPRSWNGDKEATKRHFQPAPGVYRARDLIAMFGPLLDTVIQKVGGSSPASSRDVLLHGLSSILATSGRESSLPLRQFRGAARLRARVA